MTYNDTAVKAWPRSAFLPGRCSVKQGRKILNPTVVRGVSLSPIGRVTNPFFTASPRLRTALSAAGRALPGVLWGTLVVTGFFVLAGYETTPGKAGTPAAEAEPGGANSEGYTLVMAAHPRCPCTRASMRELTVLMSRLQGRLTATVWFYTPADETESWARTGLWESAAALPGVTARADPDGRTAARLGAETSGQVLLFDPSGKRVFAGGITGARGHEGDNAGLRAVEALVLGNATAATPATTPVFGCSIRDEPSGESFALAENTAKGARR